MDETMMELVDTMQENRVAQSSIVVGVLMHMNRKSANVCAKNADDINKLLAFFKECKKNNKQFYWDAQLGEQGERLMWVDDINPKEQEHEQTREA
ncbi:hypothetical protein E2562_029471 [Oryza meyeriana var. granulata]|uniref:Uncharacterized protein n=1 Tax=Oryza meyeriana var. granulata TaxID=110450 RepID=A0A6G1DNX5_9ORYZ|nr:hypothetical protein E2562_029471 [Oryza meyeriana var. granulata]